MAREPESILVVGLGRFGSSVAQSLVKMEKEVMAIDSDADLVQRFAGEFTHVVQADATDSEALNQLGVSSFDRAVVAIGTDIEASVLTVLSLSEIGVEEIWAKAVTDKHGSILERVGAHHVVYPERDMGKRVAHQIVGSLSDYLEFEGYALARTTAPAILWGVPFSRSDIRSRYRITIVGIKREGESFTYAESETIAHRGDELIISGSVKAVEKFSALPHDDPEDSRS
ncbi:potassium channel family protein [Dermatophilus congolensis]|nr:TrkA family potassium uptake protein [Dermatophilus congolensis]MBO3129968.1 TrkA family potassium uptake protein [Dermatophilus congolensis]MBO3131402.1 TrkA family potassium uptake protein [Dermatophilus congolensis]MBO3134442.1 TrkA family potassium uptake protein [Dermatophilus congolensis]MBO3136678.1 TrkA family potassium uptake protein [Dermatophilus congolensis]MBO3138922.1 TrkA family potassium uptake protein [Dermatophilus congolensis]